MSRDLKAAFHKSYIKMLKQEYKMRYYLHFLMRDKAIKLFNKCTSHARKALKSLNSSSVKSFLQKMNNWTVTVGCGDYTAPNVMERYREIMGKIQSMYEAEHTSCR